MAIDKSIKVTNLDREFDKFKDKELKKKDNSIYRKGGNNNKSNFCTTSLVNKGEIFKTVDFDDYDNKNGGEVFTSGLLVKKMNDVKLVIDSKILEICDYIQKKFPGYEFSILGKGDWDINGNWVLTDDFEVPRQTVGRASVYYIQNELQNLKERGFNTVIHSHHTMGCGFSASDDNTINSHFPCSILYTTAGFKTATISVFYNDMKFIIEPKIEISRHTEIIVDEDILSRIEKEASTYTYIKDNKNIKGDSLFSKQNSKSDLQALIDLGNGEPITLDETSIQDAINMEELVQHLDSLMCDIIEISKNADYKSDYYNNDFEQKDFFKAFPHLVGMVKKPFPVIDTFNNIPLQNISEEHLCQINNGQDNIPTESDIFGVYDNVKDHEDVLEKLYQIEMEEREKKMEKF